MKPNGFLLSGRVGRWRWPWALFGTVVTIALVVAIGVVTEPFETWLTSHYGVESTPSDLLPGRFDTYASFVLFAVSMSLAPTLVIVGVHGLDPRHLLGPDRSFQWGLFARASLAMLLVLGGDLVVSLFREPQAYQWQSRTFAHLPWLLLALPTILYQSFAEEYLFKGYFVRVWGAVLPLRSIIVLIVAGLFTSGHAYNEDVAKDTIFNLIFFFAGEVLTLAIYLRTESIGAVTGLHWMNNVWAMCVLSTQPGQSGALSLAVYTDPILSAGRSHLTDPASYLEMTAGLTLLWLLLTWRYSPCHLPRTARRQDR